MKPLKKRLYMFDLFAYFIDSIFIFPDFREYYGIHPGHPWQRDESNRYLINCVKHDIYVLCNNFDIKMFEISK
jgi:hypothetical protein